MCRCKEVFDYGRKEAEFKEIPFEEAPFNSCTGRKSWDYRGVRKEKSVGGIVTETPRGKGRERETNSPSFGRSSTQKPFLPDKVFEEGRGRYAVRKNASADSSRGKSGSKYHSDFEIEGKTGRSEKTLNPWPL